MPQTHNGLEDQDSPTDLCQEEEAVEAEEAEDFQGQQEIQMIEVMAQS